MLKGRVRNRMVWGLEKIWSDVMGIIDLAIGGR
jgi:hypothetical protein